MTIETREQLMKWKEQTASVGQFFSADLGVALSIMNGS
jgi:hypothetical protein